MKESRVFSGDSVEEAIADGLAVLELEREQVEVEVLEEGSRGLLGIGARPARVLLTPVALPAAAPEPVVAVEMVAAPVKAPAQEDLAENARLVLMDLLRYMDLVAQVHAEQVEPADGEDDGSLVLDVRGTDADILVGRKGETLAALQHVVRLVVNRQLGKRINVVVDVNGYKQRQEHNLQRLARRMAEQAVKSGRRVVLEPMSAYERRIIHVALRSWPGVRTESEGVGRQRRVTIIPE